MDDIKSQIEKVRQSFDKDLQEAKTTGDVDSLYLKYFSRSTGESSGATVSLIRLLPDLDSDEKKTYGPILNALQQEQKEAITKLTQELERSEIEDPLIDLTYPLPPKHTGMLHPTTQIILEMNEFFRYYGYSVVEGPEIETAEYNFRKLNLPEGHPATDLQDTLFVSKPDILLTTHGSSVEARVLTDYDPPIRVAFPSKVFRNETPNSTNASFFHHYQGVVVDKGITIQHLKGTLELFHKFLFGDDVQLRFRYKYYPEVSPGMGTDMLCEFCKGSGCDVCKQRGWIEVLGSGMIHYNTLKMCRIDPEVYTGFAFGMGLDRLAMQKFGIDDIRKLYGEGIVYT
jgi:phenylalanyl-tRNA synthetase alpha chain